MDPNNIEKPKLEREEPEDKSNMFQKFFADMEKKMKEMLDVDKNSETGEQTLEKFEELKNRMEKLEESASRVRTKTRITELETNVLAEEARKREIDRVLQMMAAAQAVDLFSR